MKWMVTLFLFVHVFQLFSVHSFAATSSEKLLLKRAQQAINLTVAEKKMNVFLTAEILTQDVLLVHKVRVIKGKLTILDSYLVKNGKIIANKDERKANDPLFILQLKKWSKPSKTSSPVYTQKPVATPIATIRIDESIKEDAVLPTIDSSNLKEPTPSPQIAVSTLESQLVDHLMNRDEKFTVSFSGKDNIKLALERAMLQNDYVNYVVSGYSYSDEWDEHDNHTTVFRLTYLESKKEFDIVVKKVHELLPTIISADMNDHEKVKVVHDWIVLNVAYDQTKTSFSAYNALVNGLTVCNGYALLVDELLTELGIPVRIIEGKSGDVDHAWNLVQLDGLWYHLDTTFDDPVPDTPGHVDWNYYLLTDDQIKRDHSWTQTYPLANTNYDHFLKQQLQKQPENKQRYEKLLNETELFLLDDSYKASNVMELSALIKRLKISGNRMEFVYTSGSSFESDLDQAMQSIDGWNSYNTNYSEFKRGTDPNEVKATLNLK